MDDHIEKNEVTELTIRKCNDYFNPNRNKLVKINQTELIVIIDDKGSYGMLMGADTEEKLQHRQESITNAS